MNHAIGRTTWAAIVVLSVLIACGCDNRKASTDLADESDTTETKDPKTRAIEEDKRLAEDLAKPGKSAEARAWCSPQTNSIGFKMSKADMLKMADDAYAAGAVKVWMYDIEVMGDKQVSASMCVELPKDAAIRKKVFTWESKVAPEIDQTPSKDFGQKYLDFALD